MRCEAKRSAALCVIALALCAASASAQEQNPENLSDPPVRQLTLDPTLNPGFQPGLIATGSIFEAYDDISVSNPAHGIQSRPGVSYQQSGPYTGGDGTLAYGRQGERSTLVVGGRSAISYYPHLDTSLKSFGTFATVSKQVGQHTTLSASEYVSYAPYFPFGAYPMLGSPYGTTDLLLAVSPNLALAVVPTTVYRYHLSGDVSHQLSSRNTVTLNVMWQRADVQNDSNDYTTRQVGGRFTRAMSRNLTLRLGYGYRDGDYGGGTRFRAHNIDVGVDYHRVLSFSRRTTFAFTTGTTLLAGGAYGSVSSGLGRYQFRLLGSADLDHHIGQTWVARVSYRRDWQFVEGFVAPLFTDAVSLGVGGSLSRRATLGANGSYRYGAMGYSNANRHNAYGATGWIRYAATRSLFIYSQYLYYQYGFATTALLPVGIPQTFARNGVRAGVFFSVPLIH